jgi:hypothetical protein
VRVRLVIGPAAWLGVQLSCGQGSPNHHLGSDSNPRRSCLLEVSGTRPDGLAKVSAFIAQQAGNRDGAARPLRRSLAKVPRKGSMFDAHECIAISRHGHDHDGRDHGHGLAGGPCRGPHGPNVPRAFANLRDSGHSADGSSTPLRMEAGPNVPAPTCSGDQPVPNIHPPRRNLELEAVHTPHSGSAVAGSQCTPKSVLNSARP